MTKVLITGGAGFVGYHLAKQLLTDGCQIDLLDDLSRGVIDSDLTTLTTDSKVRLLNRDLLRSDFFDGLENDYDYIYHLAAIIGVANVLRNPYAVISDNVLMLTNILAFARQQARLKRFVFSSTSEVYAGTLQFFHLPIPTPESVPLTITELSQPRTSYMLSKICGESLCHHSDIPWTIIRPHNLYGPRMGKAHVIPQLLERAHDTDNGGINVFSVEHRRTFCYVSDGVTMIRRAAELDSCIKETLNIGNQRPEISIGKLTEMILKVMQKQLEIDPQPATSGSPVRRCPDMGKTLSLTGVKPKVDLEKGIRLTYEWYRASLFEGREVTAN